MGGVIFTLIFLTIVISVKLVMGQTALFFRTYIMLPLAAFLCTFGLLPMIHNTLLHNKVLEYWGRQSLYIYLWHVLPILALKQVFTGNKIAYYFISFTLIALFALISYMICRKVKMDDRSAY